MTGQPDGQLPPRWAPWLAVLFVIVSYPLSLGPLFWLCEAGCIAHDNSFWTGFYGPLVWLTSCVPFCEEWLFAYLGLWGM